MDRLFRHLVRNYAGVSRLAFLSFTTLVRQNEICVHSLKGRGDRAYAGLRVIDPSGAGKQVATMGRFERFEYSVITQASPQVAWELFSAWTRWPTFSDHYDTVRWTKGEPWQEGSRLRITTRLPIPVKLDHAIICCVPGEKVAWIDHALGTSLEQWVFFEAQPGGGTLVRTWAEFTGLMPLIAGRTIKEVLTEFTHTWYNRYATLCDRAAGERLGTTKNASQAVPRLATRDLSA